MMPAAQKNNRTKGTQDMVDSCGVNKKAGEESKNSNQMLDAR
jgi:hypothetical protein